MKIAPALLITALLALTVPASAEPKDELKAAIKKLAEQPNYGWNSTAKSEGTRPGRGLGPVEGKTEKDGYTHIAASVGENSFEAAFKGDKRAVLYGGQWLTPADIGEEGDRAASLLRSFKTPIQEAEELTGKSQDLKKEADGVYTGALTPEAAKEIFGKLGRRAAEAAEAKGSVKFWTKDGALAKYEFSVQGTIKVGGEEKRDVDISRTTTVEIKEVGATKVPLPEEVKKKLS